MPIIKLLSSDNEVFDVDEKVVKCSGTLKTYLEVPAEMDHHNSVTLENINSAILRKVLIWLTYHNDNTEHSDEISSWEAKFLDVDHVILCGLMEAANYLDINNLLNATAKTVADMIKGKTQAEICETFNITDEQRGADPRRTKINTVL